MIQPVFFVCILFVCLLFKQIVYVNNTNKYVLFVFKGGLMRKTQTNRCLANETLYLVRFNVFSYTLFPSPRSGIYMFLRMTTPSSMAASRFKYSALQLH